MMSLALSDSSRCSCLAVERKKTKNESVHSISRSSRSGSITIFLYKWVWWLVEPVSTADSFTPLVSFSGTLMLWKITLDLFHNWSQPSAFGKTSKHTKLARMPVSLAAVVSLALQLIFSCFTLSLCGQFFLLFFCRCYCRYSRQWHWQEVSGVSPD